MVILFFQLLPMREYAKPNENVHDDSVGKDNTSYDGNRIGESETGYEDHEKDKSCYEI